MARRHDYTTIDKTSPVAWYRTTENEDGTFEITPVAVVKETKSSLYLLRSSVVCQEGVVTRVKKDSPRKHYWNDPVTAAAYAIAQLSTRVKKLQDLEVVLKENQCAIYREAARL